MTTYTSTQIAPYYRYKTPTLPMREKCELISLCYEKKETLKKIYHIAVMEETSIPFTLKNNNTNLAHVEVTPLNEWFIYPIKTGKYFAFSPENKSFVFREFNRKTEWVAMTPIDEALKTRVEEVYLAHKKAGFPEEKSQRNGMKVIPKHSRFASKSLEKSIYISDTEELFLIDETINQGKNLRRRKIQKLISIKTGYTYILRRSGIREQTTGEAHKQEKFSRLFNNLPGCVKTIDISDYISKYENGVRIKNQKMISKFYNNLDLLSFNPNATLTDKIYVALGAAIGLRSIHSEGVIHCDIKPENIFIESFTEHGNRYFRAVIGDYGSCAFEKDKENSLGTPNFFSPKILLAKINSECPPVTKEDDIWSLGLTFAELFATEPELNNSIQNILKQAQLISQQNHDKTKINLLYIDYLKMIDTIHELLSASLNPILNEVILQMLDLQEIKRPDINQIVESLTDYLNQQLMRIPRTIQEEKFSLPNQSCCSIQ